MPRWWWRRCRTAPACTSSRRSRAARRRSCCRPNASTSRGLPADREPPRHQHVHRADHPEDAGRASGGRQVRSLLAALRDLCRRADVPRGPEGGAGASSARCSCSISASARSPATSPSCRPRCTTLEDGPRRASAPAASSARACRSRSRTTTGRELKPVETGEICVIGPAVFAGYYDNPEANAKAFRDGWFRTGDLGHMDERGLRLHHRPRLGHVHLRRLQHLSARGRGEDPDPPGDRRGRGARRARPVWGEVGVAVCVAARGRRRRPRRSCWPGWRPGCPLQDAEARLLLGGAAEVRLRQDPEAPGPRRAGSARPADSPPPEPRRDGPEPQGASARPGTGGACPVGRRPRPPAGVHPGAWAELHRGDPPPAWPKPAG